MRELGQCIRHPDEPALFRCRQCHDAVCVGCRAPGERDLCATCAQYRQESTEREARVAAGEEPEVATPRRIRWGRYLVALLVALNVGLAAYLLLTNRPDPVVAQGMEAVTLVSRAVDESRDPTGRFPASLAGLLPRLPEPVAEMVRAGTIQYETDGDRREYAVHFVLSGGGSGRR
ncbi:MAG TPA: B-box zinc finger protein [Methylomirabilota bacterium]|nr:B-box zinc finger protein [Methylomirabilota bacterium]